LEPDIGGVSAAAGKMRNASMKKAVTTRQTHTGGPRKAKRGIMDLSILEKNRRRLPLIKYWESSQQDPTSFG
jgi:hypothetical protein